MNNIIHTYIHRLRTVVWYLIYYNQIEKEYGQNIVMLERNIMLDRAPVSIETWLMDVPASIDPSSIPSGAELAQVFQSPNVNVHSSKRERIHPTKKRGRPKRDPNEGWPKRPLSAYNIFFKEYRNKLIGHEIKDVRSSQHLRTKRGYSRMRQPRKRRKKHGLITFADLAKSVGTKWKEMGECEKSFYKDIAKRNADEYSKVLGAFLKKRSQQKL